MPQADKKTTDEREEQQGAPWDRANILSKYSLSFVLPLIKLAWRNQLNLAHLPRVPDGDLSQTLGERLERNYLAECELVAADDSRGRQRQQPAGFTGTRRQRPSLVRALFRTFGLELLLANLFNTFTRMVLFPLQTVTLGWLLADVRRYSELGASSLVPLDQTLEDGGGTNCSVALDAYDTQQQQQQQWRSAAALEEERAQVFTQLLSRLLVLVASTCLASCLLHPFYFQTYHLGMKCRVAACHLIYKKALRLSQRALAEASAGQMVNLLSTDVNRFDRVVETVPFLVEAPLQAALISLILGKYYLGLWPTLAGLLVVLAFVLLQGASGRLFTRFRARAAKRADERLRLMGEVVQAIRVIKMQAWERPFLARLERARAREMTEIRNTFLVRAVNQALFFMSSKIIVFAMLLVYVQLGSGPPLEPELVFVTIGLSNLVRISISMYLANAIAQCAETRISCERISDFLLLPEIRQQQPDPLGQHQTALGFGGAAAGAGTIIFERAYAWWTSKEQMVLRNLSLTVEPGQLVLLVGRVGAGKSSVLLSVLGELELASGRLEVKGRLSYAGQEAWLFAGTIRDNILFGEPLQPARYQEVVRVCCLERDFEQLLAHGDQTAVGERGAGLSGGQRARVNLARALYRRADVYLLDDPLAALDGPVAGHIVRECLARPAGFLADKTVLLATHQLQVLRLADRVLLLDRQAPAMFGAAGDLLGSDKFKLVDYGREALEEAAARQAQAPAPTGCQNMEQPGARLDAGEMEAPPPPPQSQPPPTPTPAASEQSGRAGSAPGAQLMVSGAAQDQGELGAGVASDAATYYYYLRNCFTAPLLAGFLVTVALAQAIYLWIDFLLSSWTDGPGRLESAPGQPDEPPGFIEGWPVDEMRRHYARSVLAGLVAVLALCLIYTLASVRASRRIHGRLLERLLRAPLAYFERTPIGLLLNRLSRDLGFVDQTLPLSGLDIVLMLSNILAVLLLTVLLNPYNSPLALGLVGAALALRSASLCAITRLKQLEGVARSPVFSHLSASLNGLATIRAFKLEASFRRQFDRHQDGHSAAWFAFICATRWLGQAMDWTSVGFVSVVLIGAIVFQLDSQSAGLIGLLISQAVYMPGALQAAMRQLVEAESQLTSVQRLKELCELEVEQADVRPVAAGHSQPAPAAGCIKFLEVTLRHGPSDETEPVLRALSLLVRPRERLAIVGRTGAGKSSIIGALLRLYNFQGRIEIDGRDTRSLSLEQLRGSISIIPQEPVLFAGTLRLNLDPFGRHSDAELWAALEAVRLGSGLFARHPQGLDHLIGEGGGNFSAGQRQLICLARAIVRRNKILILDEATASVDPETDQFIQAAIKQQFAHCTVLTIAHRLATIVDSHRVLVLERGEVSELGEPHELIQNERGIFAQMIDSSGQQAAASLRRLIEEAHARRAAGQA